MASAGDEDIWIIKLSPIDYSFHDKDLIVCLLFVAEKQFQSNEILSVE
jgi:hypothetical protein